MCQDQFNIRSKILLSFLLAWAVVAAAHVFYYSSVKKESLSAEGEDLAWREGSLPAIRGRILDRQGVSLAWSELHHDLALVKEPEKESRRKALAKALGRLPFHAELPSERTSRQRAIKKDLSPEEIAICEKALAEFPEFEIEPRIERRSIDYPEVKRLLGRSNADIDSGLSFGLEGAEKENDAVLAGKAGRFKVMLDKRGNWIEGTLKILEQPKRGGDITLAVSVDEMRSLDGNWDGRL